MKLWLGYHFLRDTLGSGSVPEGRDESSPALQCRGIGAKNHGRPVGDARRIRIFGPNATSRAHAVIDRPLLDASPNKNVEPSTKVLGLEFGPKKI